MSYPGVPGREDDCLVKVEPYILETAGQNSQAFLRAVRAGMELLVSSIYDVDLGGADMGRLSI